MGLIKNVERTDISELMDTVTDQDGFLHCKIALAKPGIYPYLLEDGTIRRELKPPEELLSDATVASVNNRPVTDLHPYELLSSENWWAARGMTHSDAKVEENGDRIIVSETVFDGELIRDILSGAKAQVSGGFRCDIDLTPGEWNGESYDAVQRNIRFNHVAHVPQGRCGPECAVLFDAQDARGYRMDGEDRVPRAPIKPRGDGNPAILRPRGGSIVKFKIGDKEYEIDQAVADHISTLETAKTTLEGEKQTLTTQVENLTKERDRLRGVADAKDDATKALQAKVTELETKVTNMQQVNIDEAVSRRLQLIDTVRRFCGDSVDVIGKTEQDLKVQVIQVLNKDFKADGKSADYIQARFDAAVEALEAMVAQNGAPVGQRQLQTPRSDGETNTRLDEYKKQRGNIWQRYQQAEGGSK